MYELRRINVRSAARIATSISVVCHAAAGFLAALVYMGVRSYLANSFLATGMGALTLLLFWLALSLVVMAGAAIFGALVALLYNLFASWWGGLKVELGVANGQRPAPNGQPPTASSQRPTDDKQRSVEGAEQKPEIRKRKAENREQKSESKKQKAHGREQEADTSTHKAESAQSALIMKQRVDDQKSKAENAPQKTDAGTTAATSS